MMDEAHIRPATLREPGADRFWDWMARRYDKRVRGDENYARAVERIAGYLDAGDRVLDFACGPGPVALRIAPLVREVHAIDTSAGMIDVGTKRARESGLANVHFACRSIFDDSLRSGSYDVVLAFNILHLLEDPPEAVRRCAELLKPGGLMISSTPCLREAGVLLGALMTVAGKVLPLSHLRRFTIPDVEELIRQGGFEILESEAPDRTLPILRLVVRKQ